MNKWIAFASIILFSCIVGCTNDKSSSVSPSKEPSIYLGGNFTIENVIDVDHDPGTDYFGHLVGETISFEFNFKEYSEYTRINPTNFYKERIINALDMKGRFSGDPSLYLDIEVNRKFRNISRAAMTFRAMSDRTYIEVAICTVQNEESYGFFFWGYYSGTVDEEGYPVFEDISLSEGHYMLQRYIDVGEFQMTDIAEGTILFYLSNDLNIN